MKPVFFKTAAAFRKWLLANHDAASELYVGFYKKASGRPTITYREALDEALCFGWIDGVRKSIDDDCYVQRFTPRQRKSFWSAVNTQRVQELLAEGRMHAAGMAAFEARDPERTRMYSFEQENVAFDAAQEKIFRKQRKAWEFFAAQPPGYRRTITWWVISAKRPETRATRLDKLIAASARQKRL